MESYFLDVLDLPKRAMKMKLILELVEGGYSESDVISELEAWMENPQRGKLEMERVLSLS